jgi:hypothetical protein
MDESLKRAVTQEFPTPWGSVHVHFHIYNRWLIGLRLCAPAAMPEPEREMYWSEAHEAAHQEIAEHQTIGGMIVKACGCELIIDEYGLDTFKRIALPFEP